MAENTLENQKLLDAVFEFERILQQHPNDLEIILDTFRSINEPKKPEMAKTLVIELKEKLSCALKSTKECLTIISNLFSDGKKEVQTVKRCRPLSVDSLLAHIDSGFKKAKDAHDCATTNTKEVQDHCRESADKCKKEEEKANNKAIASGIFGSVATAAILTAGIAATIAATVATAGAAAPVIAGAATVIGGTAAGAATAAVVWNYRQCADAFSKLYESLISLEQKAQKLWRHIYIVKNHMTQGLEPVEGVKKYTLENDLLNHLDQLESVFERLSKNTRHYLEKIPEKL